MTTITPRLTTLSNGLRVVAVEMPHLNSAEIAVYLRVGGRHDSREKAGLAHFLAANTMFLASQGSPLEMDAEPTERGWEMVSILRRSCRFPKDLEMEIYAGIVGKEAAIAFLRWCAENTRRPVTAAEVLNDWDGVRERLEAQRDDLQASTMGDIVATLTVEPRLGAEQEENLVRYIDILPRDMRFGLVKSLLKIPPVAQAISQDKYDAVVFDAIRTISADAQ